jgi:nucleoside-diphosphate-sugar epimerase
VIETVLVTGAAGNLGGRLVARLQADGLRVRALTHRRRVPAADEEARGSILDDESCAEAVSGCAAVLHAAAVTHARREASYRDVNVAGTDNLVRAAEAAGVRRFLLVSSRTASERGGWYSRSKLDAERIVTASSLAWTIVRLPEVYGARSREGIDDIIAKVRRGKPVLVPGRGDSELCPLHVDDAVSACANALLLERAIGKAYTVGGRCLTVREFTQRCIAAAGSSSRIVPVPWAILRLVAAIGRFSPLPVFPDQVDRLRVPKPRPAEDASSELSFAVRALDDGLREALGASS